MAAKSNHETEIWLVTGSQHLYGEKTLKQVADNSLAIVNGLNHAGTQPVKIIFKPVVTTPDEILKVCTDASSSGQCLGIITWMHTFSPTKMWIAGLNALKIPFLHLHTQFNRDMPWND